MRVGGKSYRSVWLDEAGRLQIIDQTALPYAFQALELPTIEAVATAIKTMQVRGAPLIGVTAAFGVWLAMGQDPSDRSLEQARKVLAATRPTAINLRWALEQMDQLLRPLPAAKRVAAARDQALLLAEQDVETCRRIGDHGFALLEKAAQPGEVLNVLTHCNAGWLATVDWGTALAPIYRCHDAGIAIHVWVDETRPRNQGMLTAWELGQHGVPHTLIADNEGGHLMQRGKVDLCIVGSDRTTANGDVCNKIGTYLKALAAQDNAVPFYVALPSSTLDWTLDDGASIPIEERSADEVMHVNGVGAGGQRSSVKVAPLGTTALNHAFDVTPARLVTGIITERGVCPATRSGLAGLFPEPR